MSVSNTFYDFRSSLLLAWEIERNGRPISLVSRLKNTHRIVSFCSLNRILHSRERGSSSTSGKNKSREMSKIIERILY